MGDLTRRIERLEELIPEPGQEPEDLFLVRAAALSATMAPEHVALVNADLEAYACEEERYPGHGALLCHWSPMTWAVWSMLNWFRGAPYSGPLWLGRQVGQVYVDYGDRKPAIDHHAECSQCGLALPYISSTLVDHGRTARFIAPVLLFNECPLCGGSVTCPNI